MATKTEYREYIASEGWRQRRKEFLAQGYDECNRCGLPRRLVIIAYDEDFHVHHRSYARIGSELDEDLEPLCKRCHELETFGSTNLHEPQQFKCQGGKGECLNGTWDRVTRLCSFHLYMDSFGASDADEYEVGKIIWGMVEDTWRASNG